MDKYLSIVWLLIAANFVVNARRINRNAGYYWKTYEGVIPSDALLAGYDLEKPVYIGQATIDDILIPGKIYDGDSNLYYEWGGQAWSTANYVKVLCTEHPEQFKWISTSNDNLLRLSKRLLVDGGYQRGFKTYIGRLQHPDGGTVVGKVLCNDSYCLALYGVKDGKQVEYHSYEVLRYNPSNVRRVDTNNFPAYWT